MQFLAARNVPQGDDAVPPPGRQRVAIPGEGQSGNAVGLPGEPATLRPTRPLRPPKFPLRSHDMTFVEATTPRKLEAGLYAHDVPAGWEQGPGAFGGLVKEITPDVEDYVDEFEWPCEGDDYLRVEVRGFRGRPERGEVVHALTNPIYWGSW